MILNENDRSHVIEIELKMKRERSGRFNFTIYEWLKQYFHHVK